MHPLDDVTTVVEHTANVFRIDGASEMRIAVVFAVAGSRRDAQELVADEVLGAYHLQKYPPFHWFQSTIRLLRILRLMLGVSEGFQVGRCAA